MNPRLEGAMTAVLVLAAVVVAATAAHREFYGARVAVISRSTDPPEFVPEWKDLAKKGVLRGPADAAVQIVEFTDLACSVCRRFHDSFRAVQKTRSNQIALIFLHFPLAIHPFGRPAARAAECALVSGRFAEFQDIVFAKQDSLGLKSWASFAREAGLRDTTAFVRCASDTATVSRIEEGVALGKKIHVAGTPTVLIIGWRFTYLAADSLGRIVDRVAAGRPPLASMQR